MTIPKKGSRTTRVDDLRYRWKANQSVKADITVFTAHLDKEPADSTLRVTMAVAHCDVVTPEVAENLIRGARGLGWNPLAKGLFEIDADQAIPILGG